MGALQSSIAVPGAIEKFIVLSGETLPVKPFSVVHSVLTSYAESDFCITPAEEWRYAFLDGAKAFLVKHSQWVIFNREHASRLVHEWKAPMARTTDRGWWTVPLREGTWAR